MIVSVTERGTFRRCRQQWDYGSFNRQGLTSRVPPTALSFGSLIHKAHENWLLEPNEDPQSVVLKAAIIVEDELRRHYIETIGVAPHDNELSGFHDQVTLALEVMNNYKQHWGASLPEGFTLVQPEQTILIPIPNTEHLCANAFHGEGNLPDVKCPECGGPWTSPQVILHYLEGTFDFLARDSGGRMWIGERKTYNQRPRVDALMMNDQFLGYMWVISQLDMGPLGGLIYDGMWKRNRIDERGKDRGLDALFHREFIIRAPEELINFEKHLRAEVMEMANPDVPIYLNRRWEGCWDCQFANLCVSEFRGEDSEYVRQAHYTQRKRNEWQNDDSN